MLGIGQVELLRALNHDENHDHEQRVRVRNRTLKAINDLRNIKIALRGSAARGSCGGMLGLGAMHRPLVIVRGNLYG